MFTSLVRLLRLVGPVVTMEVSRGPLPRQRYNVEGHGVTESVQARRTEGVRKERETFIKRNCIATARVAFCLYERPTVCD